MKKYQKVTETYENRRIDRHGSTFYVPVSRISFNLDQFLIFTQIIKVSRLSFEHVFGIMSREVSR